MESPFAFTDGSYLSNPGPGGEVIYTPHHKAIPLTKPVCKRGFILLGELVAILITVEYFMEQSEESPGKVLKILRDRQATVAILTVNCNDTSYRHSTGYDSDYAKNR